MDDGRKMYKLILCEGEDDEETVFANLTYIEAHTIMNDIHGLNQGQFLIKLTDGRSIDIGIIDKIEGEF